MEIPRHWRIRKQRYSMQGGSCPNCNAKMFPVREVCPNCGYGQRMMLNNQAELFAQPVAIPNHVLNA